MLRPTVKNIEDAQDVKKAFPRRLQKKSLYSIMPRGFVKMILNNVSEITITMQ